MRVPELAQSLPDLGSVKELAPLLLRARDRSATGGGLNSVLSGAAFEAGGRLVWSTTTELKVADADALEKERGVRKLIRVTGAVSVLGSVAGEGGASTPAIVSAWGSCLQQDWDDDLRAPIEAALASFAPRGA